MRHGWLLIPLFLMTACASARRGEIVERAVQSNDPQVTRGEQVFMQNCYQCHQGGEGGLGPVLNDKPLPASLIRLRVRHHIGAMPGFSEAEISEEDLNALIAYMMALRNAPKRP